MIIGSFLNISAVTNYIKRNAQNVLFVCAGWEGNISPEDMIFAGAILEQLGSVIGSMDDAAVIALNSWKNNKPEFRAWLRQTSHVQRLLKLGLAKDIEYCFSLDLFPGVPLLSGREIIMTLIIS